MGVLAMLTAAAGPLALEDLATLTTEAVRSTPAHTSRVRHLVIEETARSLQPVGLGDQSALSVRARLAA